MKRVWEILRWFVLGGLVLVVLLILTIPDRPDPDVTPADQKQFFHDFEQKMMRLEQAKASGVSGTTEQFSTEEVNASLQDMATSAQKAMGPGSAESADAKIVGVNFNGDEAIGQFVVHQYGRDFYITMSGHLGAKGGYANLEITKARIGNLSVPAALINSRLQQKLAEPEQRERLKLPDFVADMRVEDGKLVIVEK